MAKFMLLRLAALVVAVAVFSACGITEAPWIPKDASVAATDASASPDGVVGSDGVSTGSDSAASTDVAVEEPKGCPTSHRPDATTQFPLDGSDGTQYICLSADSSEEKLATMIETSDTDPKNACSGTYYSGSDFCNMKIDLLAAKDPAASLRIRIWWPDVADLSPLEADIYCKDDVCEGKVEGNLFDGMVKAIRFTFNVSTKQIALTITWSDGDPTTWEYQFN